MRFGPKGLILTPTGSSGPKQKFDNLDKLANSETVNLTFSDDSRGLGITYLDDQNLGPCRYIEGKMVDREDAVSVK